jgi:hypothetical protein
MSGKVDIIPSPCPSFMVLKTITFQKAPKPKFCVHPISTKRNNTLSAGKQAVITEGGD